MTLQERIASLIFLGEKIKEELDKKTADKVIEQAYLENNWFSHEFIRLSLNHIANYYLNRDKLEKWLSSYELKNNNTGTTALILAGNLPLVGFHDVICNYISGKKSLIRMSHRDKILLPWLISKLTEFHRDNDYYFAFEDRLKNFDAVIATGSNNTSVYFEYYFGKYPHIIRKNRNSVAVLKGNETPEELIELAKDVFYYYGLGCRNVSKLLVPQGYDFSLFFKAAESFKYFDNFFRYANNYQYNKSIYLVNKIPHYDTGFLLVKEDQGFHPPVSVLFYQIKNSDEEIQSILELHRHEIQLIVGKETLKYTNVPFGKTQFPELWDYADNVDTIKFLLSI